MSIILLVDDERNIMAVLELLLVAEGYRVIATRNGAEAIGAASVYPPQLFISDWMMPVLDGARLCRCFHSTLIVERNSVCDSCQLRCRLPSCPAGRFRESRSTRHTCSRS
ncbi:response regulator [Caballeronia glathei]|uniref:response regulator n=1 Tax=Caballeronia glathei TaxID=60547 RepID=UPI00094EAB0C|nr:MULTISPECIES: response regulator [Burkholderiaceae]